MRKNDKSQPGQKHASASSHGHQGHGRRHSFKKESKPVFAKNYQPENLKVRIDQGDYVIFDIETTGGNPEKNGITEICALRIKNGEPISTFYSLVNPRMAVPPIVRKMTGINNKMLADQPFIEEVMPKFVEYIGDAVLVSHNTIGDVKFLRYFSKQTVGKEIENFYICTHLLTERLLPEAPNKSLKGLAQHYNFAQVGYHRANEDAKATHDLFKLLISRLKENAIDTVDGVIRFQGDYESGMRLGWSVQDHELHGVPKRPGIFHLYDERKKRLFHSSAMQLHREVLKLKDYSQIPRPLLRLVLKAHSLSYHETSSYLEAALLESKESQARRQPPKFDPVLWHGRTINCIALVKAGRHFKLTLGEMVPGTIAAFGPINDRKVARKLFEKLGHDLHLPHAGKDLQLNKAQLEVIRAFFSGQLSDLKTATEKRLKSLLLIVWTAKRKLLEEQLACIRKVAGLQLGHPLSDLSACSGVIVLPGKNLSGYKVLLIAHARLVDEWEIQSTWYEYISKAANRKRIAKKITAKCQKLYDVPFSKLEAKLANALLWWVHSQTAKREGLFARVEDLL